MYDTLTKAQRQPTAPGRPLHVVVIDEELPYPLLSGKRLRTMGLISRLAQRHRLTYVCHRNADRAEARIAEEHFAEMGVRTVVVDRPVPPKSGPGFYARLAMNLLSRLPYWMTRWGLSSINRREQRPFVFYLHPWEIDPDQPRVACGWKQRFRHYTGLTRTEGRLCNLLRDFRLGTLSDALAAYNPAARQETTSPVRVRQAA